MTACLNFPRCRAFRRGKLPAVVIAVFLAITSAVHAEESSATPANSPSTIAGTADVYVPSFYTRVVTGPLMNRSVCYVCRNGQRPVAIIVIRSLGPELRPLLRNIDRLVDRNRIHGLRSFGVILSDTPSKSASAVQTFAFDNKIEMPLTVATEAVSAPGALAIRDDADVTVVLYRKRRIVSRFSFKKNDLDTDEVRNVLTSIRSLVAVEASRTVGSRTGASGE